MMKCLDGPAAGQVLMIRRAPLFLRVVRNPLVRKANKEDREWDCLNELQDQPKPHEELHVYVLKEKPGWCHIRMSRRSASGFYSWGEYVPLQEQPDDATMRSTELWRKWCTDNAPRLAPAWWKEGKDLQTKQEVPAL